MKIKEFIKKPWRWIKTSPWIKLAGIKILNLVKKKTPPGTAPTPGEPEKPKEESGFKRFVKTVRSILGKITPRQWFIISGIFLALALLSVGAMISLGIAFGVSAWRIILCSFLATVGIGMFGTMFFAIVCIAQDYSLEENEKRGWPKFLFAVSLILCLLSITASVMVFVGIVPQTSTIKSIALVTGIVVTASLIWKYRDKLKLKEGAGTGSGATAKNVGKFVIYTGLAVGIVGAILNLIGVGMGKSVWTYLEFGLSEIPPLAWFAAIAFAIAALVSFKESRSVRWCSLLMITLVFFNLAGFVKTKSRAEWQAKVKEMPLSFEWSMAMQAYNPDTKEPLHGVYNYKVTLIRLDDRMIHFKMHDVNRTDGSGRPVVAEFTWDKREPYGTWKQDDPTVAGAGTWLVWPEKNGLEGRITNKADYDSVPEEAKLKMFLWAKHP